MRPCTIYYYVQVYPWYCLHFWGGYTLHTFPAKPTVTVHYVKQHMRTAQRVAPYTELAYTTSPSYVDYVTGCYVTYRTVTQYTLYVILQKSYVTAGIKLCSFLIISRSG